MIGTGTSSGENHFKAAGANWIYNESVLGTFVDEVSSSCGGPVRNMCWRVYVCTRVRVYFFFCRGEGVEMSDKSPAK